MRRCAVECCDRQIGKGAGRYCHGHQMRRRRGRPLDTPLKRRRPNGASKHPCSVPGCYRPQVAREMCSPHYLRWMRRGVGPDSGVALTPAKIADEVKDVQVRVSAEVARALDKQARSYGYTRSAWLRLILERQVAEMLKADAEAKHELGPYSGRAA